MQMHMCVKCHRCVGKGKGVEGQGVERAGSLGLASQGEGSLAGSSRSECEEEGLMRAWDASFKEFALKELEICCEVVSGRELQTDTCSRGPSCWRRARQGAEVRRQAQTLWGCPDCAQPQLLSVQGGPLKRRGNSTAILSACMSTLCGRQALCRSRPHAGEDWPPGSAVQ